MMMIQIILNCLVWKVIGNDFNVLYLDFGLDVMYLKFNKVKLIFYDMMMISSSGLMAWLVCELVRK
jgi:hypothetical protein